MNVLFMSRAGGVESVSAGSSLPGPAFFLSPSRTAVFFHSHHHTANATSPTRTSTPTPTPTPTATTLTPLPSPPPVAATEASPVVKGVPVPSPFEALVAVVLAVFDAVVVEVPDVVLIKSASSIVKYADDTLGAGTFPWAAASVPLKIQKKNSSDWARSKPYSWTVQRNDVCGGDEACLAARGQLRAGRGGGERYTGGRGRGWRPRRWKTAATGRWCTRKRRSCR
ncbi:hypothetical protein B0T18DRAFT_53173 [Schizothecium vesticola]|uniref:Uncharacterized protein n=1 Tax=Schizothecium vesticola TaxID=314040 RepID=A0AA40FC70_9PEZI|nr:hypothetical protein B0T18DRAFT_53173 [Schizothecium vesticola]